MSWGQVLKWTHLRFSPVYESEVFIVPETCCCESFSLWHKHLLLGLILAEEVQISAKGGNLSEKPLVSLYAAALGTYRNASYRPRKWNSSVCCTAASVKLLLSRPQSEGLSQLILRKKPHLRVGWLRKKKKKMIFLQKDRRYLPYSEALLGLPSCIPRERCWSHGNQLKLVLFLNNIRTFMPLRSHVLVKRRKRPPKYGSKSTRFPGSVLVWSTLSTDSSLDLSGFIQRGPETAWHPTGHCTWTCLRPRNCRGL